MMHRLGQKIAKTKKVENIFNNGKAGDNVVRKITRKKKIRMNSHCLRDKGKNFIEKKKIIDQKYVVGMNFLNNVLIFST